MADPWVRPPSPGPPDPGAPSRPENEGRPSNGKTHPADDYLLVDRLREEAALGRMDLDSILSEATHAARYFTDATGAALALWSQGVVICRARSGETAPPLGAKLDVDSGVWASVYVAAAPGAATIRSQTRSSTLAFARNWAFDRSRPCLCAASGAWLESSRCFRIAPTLSPTLTSRC